MEINLSKDSVVDHRTGEVEVNIARCDDEIAALRADLKAVKDRRDKLVGQLRAGIRDGEVLPLLELADPPADPEDGE